MKRKAYGRQIGRWAKRMRPYVSTALGMYNKWRIGRTSTRTRRNKFTKGNLTFQNDEAMLYRRKGAPRRVKSRARKSFKRFTYNLDKCQGMRTFIINHYTTGSTGANPTLAEGQITSGVTLYGYGDNTYPANSNEGNGDMPFIFARENAAYPSATSATKKLRFRSAVLDFTLKNTTPDDANDLGGLMICDIYRVQARRNMADPAALSGDPAAFWSSQVNKQVVGNLPTAITDNRWFGSTPFDAPEFGSAWKIMTKRRIRISAGNVYNGQLRDAGNYVLDMSEVTSIRQKAGVTEGYIFVMYNASMANGSECGPINYELNTRKTYHYTETLSSSDVIGGEA